MMPFPPFYGFPGFRRYYYPHNSSSVHNNFDNKDDLNKKNSNENDIFIRDINNSNSDEEVFDFFGLKLSFDDLLILAILFFLYKEDTKDPYIFIALILLLLS